MRPPLYAVAVSLTAGVSAGAALPLSPHLCFGAAAGIGVAGVRWWPALLAACFLAGASGSAVKRTHASGDCRLVWQPGDKSAVVRILDAPGGNGVADARVLFAPSGCSGVVRVRLDAPGVQSGATVIAVGVVRGRGVFRVDHVRPLPARRPVRFVIRDAVRTRIVALYGNRAPIIEAMILGRRHELRSDTRDAFIESGLAHLLAISGLHVGIVATLVTLGLRRFSWGARPWGWGAALTWCYVALLGFPVPATRAAIFVTVAAGSRFRGRHPPLEAVIAVSVLCILLLDPLAVRSPGAWLSVCAVWSTARSTNLVEGTAKRWARFGGALRLLAASTGATVGTAPITALVFGNVAPIGIAANLVAVPLASLAVPAVFLSLAGGASFAAGAGVLLGLLEGSARFFGTIPGGHLEGVPGVAFAAPWSALAALAVWLAVRRPVYRVAVWRLATGLTVIAWALAVLPAMPIAGGRGLLEVHMLDVGQGDAIAIKTPRDRWVLIDGGPRTPTWDAGARIVVPFLKRRGVRTLSAAILSHGDADHLGGLSAVVRQVRTDLVLEPGVPLGSRLYVDFLGLLDETGTSWLPARAGDTMLVDSVRFAVLHPDAAWLANITGPNESSLVVHVSYGALDILMTGDIGWPAESTLIAAVPDVEILKVGHHGSRGGTRNAWLDAVRPEAALISVGRGNRYGHPAQEVIDRLENSGARVFRTDEDGPVTLRSDGRYYELVAHGRAPVTVRLLCLLVTSLPSSGSSWSRSVCSPRRPGNSRIFSTTSP